MTSSDKPKTLVTAPQACGKPLGLAGGTKGDNDMHQRERFEQAARELGVDLDEGKLREVLRQIADKRAEGKPDRKIEPDR